MDKETIIQSFDSCYKPVIKHIKKSIQNVDKTQFHAGEFIIEGPSMSTYFFDGVDFQIISSSTSDNIECNPKEILDFIHNRLESLSKNSPKEKLEYITQLLKFKKALDNILVEYI